jgi:hypothetical protein
MPRATLEQQASGYAGGGGQEPDATRRSFAPIMMAREARRTGLSVGQRVTGSDAW